MNVLVAGSSGLVGSKLVPALLSAGHVVRRLVRDRAKLRSDDVFWDPASGQIDASAVAAADAVINLAGESIAAGRWTAQRKTAIVSSRVDATSTLAKALAAAPSRGRALINASAIGYYGNRGDEVLDESSSSGSGDFLSGVCRQWESATRPAVDAGVRVALLRFGVILSRQGGALQKMLTPFRLGLGGVVGSGKQYMSWVTLDDVVGAILHCLTYPNLEGPVNVVAPQPVTNAEFTKTLGAVLHRPTIFPLPAFAARLAFGQMGDELLLASQRVRPARLLASNYVFGNPQLSGALEHVLNER